MNLSGMDTLLDAITCGDNLQVLKAVPDNSVDLLATDPPYGLAFMGKDWDRALPGIDIWKECFRVLKPGAWAFVMSIPRSDCYARMIGRLIKAGFDVSFTPIFWAYATGFPKAMNMAKAVMKHVGDKGRVVGTERVDAGIQSGSMHAGRVSRFVEREVRVPTDARAKELEGSYAGFQPKPAVEVIIVAMKPMSEETFVDQALSNKKGITWLDECRIPFQGEHDKSTQALKNPHTVHAPNAVYGDYSMCDKPWVQPPGRFPANLLVSDDVLNDGNVTKSQGGKSGHTAAYSGGFKEEYYQGAAPGYGDVGSFSRYFDVDKWWDTRLSELPEAVQRTFPFLILPKASKSERNTGLEESGAGHVVKMTQHGGAWLCECGRKYAAGLECCPRCGSRQRQLYHVGSRPVANIHPTVKPLKLMAYLITLGSRQGDIVLDPFVGSGTTALAAKLLGRRFVAIELEPRYVEIAKARLGTLEAESSRAGV